MRLHRIAPGYYQTPDELYRIVRECEEGERFWTIYAHEGKRGYPAGKRASGQPRAKMGLPALNGGTVRPVGEWPAGRGFCPLLPHRPHQNAGGQRATGNPYGAGHCLPAPWARRQTPPASERERMQARSWRPHDRPEDRAMVRRKNETGFRHD